jgi:hypothetical protein
MAFTNKRVDESYRDALGSFQPMQRNIRFKTLVVLLGCLSPGWTAGDKAGNANSQSRTSSSTDDFRVTISSIPSGANVELGTATPSTSPMVSCGITPKHVLLKPGAYRIKLTLHGFETWEQNVALQPGIENVVAATLRRSPAATPPQRPVERSIPVVSTSGAPPSAQAPILDAPLVRRNQENLNAAPSTAEGRDSRARETSGGTYGPGSASTGPFGLHRGMTKEQVIQLIGRGAITQQANDMIAFSTVPKPHPEFRRYLMWFSPSEGLLKIGAFGAPISTNGYGWEVRQGFARVLDALRRTYSMPQEYDFLLAGSIWKEPQYWMMGLLKKDRSLTAIWNRSFVASNELEGIALQALAASSSEGYLLLSYEFEGWEAYRDAKVANAGEVF